MLPHPGSRPLTTAALRRPHLQRIKARFAELADVMGGNLLDATKAEVLEAAIGALCVA